MPRTHEKSHFPKKPLDKKGKLWYNIRWQFSQYKKGKRKKVEEIINKELYEQMYPNGIPETKYKILSWSGGIQSTVMAVMSALGELPKVDLVLYANIGNEWSVVTETMAFYKNWLQEKGMRIETVYPPKSVLEELEEGEIHIPAWTESGGPLYRGCVWRYKIRPIRWKIREFAGYHATKNPYPKKNTFEMWLGMTTDEMKRTLPSLKKYIFHRFPLVEKGLSRGDCYTYLRKLDLPIMPKTACVVCPYRKAWEWLEIKEKTPEEWEEAIRIDRKIRNALQDRKKESNKIYIWKKSIPLEEVDLKECAKHERGFDYGV